MASLIQRGRGMWAVQFFLAKGKRRTIALDTKNERRAVTIKDHIEDLVSANRTGTSANPATVAWLGTLNPDFLRRLAKTGLVEIEGEDAAELTLGPFVENYVVKRAIDVKPATVISWRQAQGNLIAFFGADKPLPAITAGDAADFERYLRSAARNKRKGADGDSADSEDSRTLSPATIRKRISNAKLFFGDAVARELIAKNPFAGLKSAARSNRERDHFISRNDANKIIDACPDFQWRLIFALSRWGGLRCPSEHLALRWTDVYFERGRMTVHSPKTEGYEGKASREVPLFAELRCWLEEAADVYLSTDGVLPEFVITRYRDTTQNLRTSLRKIIKRAGLEPWPKLFANMRATRATELAEQFPGHVAAAWLGHSEQIANRHYRQVTDEHFLRAATPTQNCSADPSALRFCVHGAPQDDAGSEKRPAETALRRRISQDVALLVGPPGLEPGTKGL